MGISIATPSTQKVQFGFLLLPKSQPLVCEWMFFYYYFRGRQHNFKCYYLFTKGSKTSSYLLELECYVHVLLSRVLKAHELLFIEFSIYFLFSFDLGIVIKRSLLVGLGG